MKSLQAVHKFLQATWASVGQVTYPLHLSLPAKFVIAYPIDRFVSIINTDFLCSGIATRSTTRNSSIPLVRPSDEMTSFALFKHIPRPVVFIASSIGPIVYRAKSLTLAYLKSRHCSLGYPSILRYYKV